MISNPPDEPEAWSADFSYEYLRSTLYPALRDRFDTRLLRDYPITLKETGVHCFVRHDVDVDLYRAWALGKIDAAAGIASTFHVMLDSPFYDIKKADARMTLDALHKLGHEIGLHYDPRERPFDKLIPGAVEKDVRRRCEELEDITGRLVSSVSFHRPSPELLNGPEYVGGRVNACSKQLLGWYLSDSRGRWREGEPTQKLHIEKTCRLQILIHPIWWGEHHREGSERLRNWLTLQEPADAARWESLRAKLTQHILFQAANREG